MGKRSAGAASLDAVECQVQEEDTLPHYFPRTIDTSEADDSISDDVVSGDATADICELIGFDMGESLDRELGKPFNEEELKEAYANSGYFDAKPSQKPSAMWLIGPSACGKSTLAPQAAKWVGMDQEGYVTVDGEAFRDAHGGYKKAILKGRQHGCVWWGAYLGIRENINEEKQELLEAAMKDRKNLLIPSTCLRRSQCVDVTESLRGAGYDIHIIGVFGDKDTIVERGRKRAADQGKRYDPREFELALMMFAPMLRLCTGMWRMVCTTGQKDWNDLQVSCGGEGPLLEDGIEQVCTDVFEIYREDASQGA
ncbi:unnamed protein product [Symbiodinium sp. KB8]|nr:unnamed protein product [Symbiodinium sp. KB8]